MHSGVWLDSARSLICLALGIAIPGCSHLSYDVREDVRQSEPEIVSRSPGELGLGRIESTGEGCSPTDPCIEIVQETVERVRYERKVERTIDLGVSWNAMYAEQARETDADQVLGGLVGLMMFAPLDLTVLALSPLWTLPAAPFAALDGSREKIEEDRKRRGPLADTPVLLEIREVDFRSSGRTDSRGRISAGLPAAAHRLLLRGDVSGSLRITEQSRGREYVAQLGTAELQSLLSAHFRSGGAEAAGWWRTYQDIPESADQARQVVLANLERLGARFARDDEEALRLLAGGARDVLMPDGALVDWGGGEPRLPPYARSRVELAAGSGRIRAGDPLRLEVEVANRGKGALVRLQGRTRSEQRSLDGIPILVGRVGPGETVRRSVQVPTLHSLPGGEHTIQLDFEERNGYAPRSTALRFTASDALRPAFALAVTARDDGSGSSSGNGDERVQRGEAIELHLKVRNVGAVAAADVEMEIGMPELEGADLFGERRHALGGLAPGAEAEVSVVVAIKPRFDGERLPLSAWVRDGRGLASKNEDLSLAVDQGLPDRVIALDEEVEVRTATDLRSAAAPQARRVARVDPGARLRVTGEQSGFYRVEYAGPGGELRQAWVARSSTAPVSSTGTARAEARAPESTPRTPLPSAVREFANVPPLIALLSPAEDVETKTSGDQIRIQGLIKDDSGVASWILENNGREVASLGTRGIAKAPTRPQRRVDIDRAVALEPGPNRLVLRARDEDGDETRVQAVVVRSTRVATVAALVIGIDDYADPAITDLGYAEADARAFADFLRSERSMVSNPDEVRLLLGRDATVVNIRTWIERQLVRRATHEEDMAVLYFAGHGYSEGEKTYLAGVDTRLDNLRATGFSDSDLRDYWNDIEAGRRILVADACHAGGLRGTRGSNDVASGLARSLAAEGSIRFMASGPRQLSVESEELGHGVFTWALLQGLSGRADEATGDNDGRVSAKELASWLDREVPALARREGGSQNPSFRAETDGVVHLTR